MAIYQPKRRNPDTKKMEPSEVYWCDFTYLGRRIRESTGQTLKTLAKKYEDRRKREMENAVAGVTPATASDRIKDLKTAIGEWIEVRAAGKKATTKRFIADRCAHLIKHLGARLVCDINEKAVASYIGKREAEGAAAISINRETFFLARVLRVDKKVAWPEVGRSHKASEPVGKALTHEDEEGLLVAARKNKSKYALPFIATAMFTGFRAGEVRTMKWRQVDLIHGWIRSEQSKTKAGEYREVPIMPELRQILADHRAWIQKRLESEPESDHYVFPFSSRGMPVDPERSCTNIASSWWQIREDAGVTCRLHDLRHSYVTRLIEAGVSEAIVRELVGHIDPMVLRRYTHIRREAKKKAIEQAFGGGAEPHVNISPNVGPVEAQDGGKAKRSKPLIM